MAFIALDRDWCRASDCASEESSYPGPLSSGDLIRLDEQRTEYWTGGYCSPEVTSWPVLCPGSVPTKHVKAV